MPLVKVFVDKVESESGGRPVWVINSPDARDIHVQGPTREEAVGLFKELCSRAIPGHPIRYAMVIRKQHPGPVSGAAGGHGYRAVM